MKFFLLSSFHLNTHLAFELPWYVARTGTAPTLPERSALLPALPRSPKHLGLTPVQEWIQHLVNQVASPECLKPAIKFCELVKRELLGARPAG